MDLPKELLQKYLPQKDQRGEKTQDSMNTQGGKVRRPPPIKGEKTAASELSHAFAAPAPNAPPEQPDSDDENALFMQAMQGMVRKSRPHPKSGNHGAFPLPLPASLPTSQHTAAMKHQADTKTTVDTPKTPLPLVADSDDAFSLAMRTVIPLKGKGRDIPPSVETVNATVAQSLYALLDKDMVFDVHLAGEQVQGQLVGLDPKVLTSLVSGSQSPEARLDLHGMNAAQAFQALVPFFKSAWHKGLRTVIVVTGRGVNSPTGMAVLRQKVSSWLTQEPFKRVVMAFSTAQPCDGGTGSMYILLRKFRKKHPVYWERNPTDSDIF